MASTTLDMTAANAALKELYSGQVVENLVYRDNPFLAMVPKKTDVGGKYFPQPIITGASQGRSATFANAQTYQAAVAIQEFLITRVSDYSIATITNEAMLAAKTDKMAFIESSKVLIDGAIRSATNSLASGLFRSGTGSLVYGSYATATDTVTVSPPQDIAQIEVNMALQAASTDGGASITGDTTVGYVVSVNRSAGTFVVSTSLGGAHATPTGWTNATSYYFRQAGDRNLKISGLGAWIPTTAPTSTTFFGVDRSVDSIRLGGVRYDGSSAPIEEALIQGSALIAREGGKPDVGICSYGTWAALSMALGSKTTYTQRNVGDIGFRGIVVNGANTQIEVFPDRNCPAGLAYLLQMDTWKLLSLGDAPMILRYGDGNEMLRVYNSDASEVRVGYYAQLATSAPGWNGVVQTAI